MSHVLRCKENPPLDAMKNNATSSFPNASTRSARILRAIESKPTARIFKKSRQKPISSSNRCEEIDVNPDLILDSSQSPLGQHKVALNEVDGPKSHDKTLLIWNGRDPRAASSSCGPPQGDFICCRQGLARVGGGTFQPSQSKAPVVVGMYCGMSGTPTPAALYWASPNNRAVEYGIMPDGWFAKVQRSGVYTVVINVRSLTQLINQLKIEASKIATTCVLATLSIGDVWCAGTRMQVGTGFGDDSDEFDWQFRFRWMGNCIEGLTRISVRFHEALEAPNRVDGEERFRVRCDGSVAAGDRVSEESKRYVKCGLEINGSAIFISLLDRLVRPELEDEHIVSANIKIAKTKTIAERIATPASNKRRRQPAYDLDSPPRSKRRQARQASHKKEVFNMGALFREY
jgi:hypothetical protein